VSSRSLGLLKTTFFSHPTCLLFQNSMTVTAQILIKKAKNIVEGLSKRYVILA
jgi:hypothetical protein